MSVAGDGGADPETQRLKFPVAFRPGVTSPTLSAQLAATYQRISRGGNGQVVGIDRGVAVSAALSTGQLLRVPGLGGAARSRLPRLQRTLARAPRGSHRRRRVRHAMRGEATGQPGP